MDGGLDLSSLWSWTIPLWGLFVIVLYLAGELIGSSPLLGAGAPLPNLVGGGSSKSKSRK
jgi:hypothetical protein